MTSDDHNAGVYRDHATYHLVCDDCGSEWDNVHQWLDNDPCMPERRNGE